MNQAVQKENHQNKPDWGRWFIHQDGKDCWFEHIPIFCEKVGLYVPATGRHNLA